MIFGKPQTHVLDGSIVCTARGRRTKITISPSSEWTLSRRASKSGYSRGFGKVKQSTSTTQKVLRFAAVFQRWKQRKECLISVLFRFYLFFKQKLLHFWPLWMASSESSRSDLFEGIFRAEQKKCWFELMLIMCFVCFPRLPMKASI